MKKSSTYRYSALTAVGGVAFIGIAAAASNMSSSITRPSSGIVVVEVGAVSPATASTQKVTAPESVASPSSVSPVQKTRVLAGVNIAGGEFGKVPGRMNHQYIYPSLAEIDYYEASGLKLLRIPFRWERLQPDLYGPLAPADRAELRKITEYATSKGMVVVLDMHDYARRRARPGAETTSIIGTADVPASALADAWTKIVEDYRHSSNVWLGLMNEPNGVGASDWWRTVQQLVNDLRSQHVTNKLLVPGVSWTGAHSWLKSGNADQAARFKDPGNNFAFEVHQYLDKDSSGTKGTCWSGSAQRVDNVLSWAKQSNVKLFFGEIAAGPDAVCQTEYGSMLKKLNTSPAVVGWAAWGAGRWWAESYMFRLAPLNGATTPHMAMLRNNLPS
ncbi:glycoside hydrolase family 5 protein [Sphingomonas sp. Ag1]|jgi:endoglucanase|uniref:glycoside hydrolase family 5 protein n=1 Tax=Sphingomonas sp. Ag1 TaxID=1642949 RepID=UPI000621DE81|nr:glycoside hydrolase family 5 protein [Sphingomonas sp. Ag1]KKI20373.1 hypothetical protein XM50_05800 [Sphingomonas sp. Ag1]